MGTRVKGSDFELIEKKLHFVAKYSTLQLYPKKLSWVQYFPSHRICAAS